jgi:hypothetical protein
MSFGALAGIWLFKTRTSSPTPNSGSPPPVVTWTFAVLPSSGPSVNLKVTFWHFPVA